MGSATVKVNGTTIDSVISVDFEKTFEPEQDAANINIADFNEVDNITSADEVKIFIDGTLRFTGVVTDADQGLSKATYTVNTKGNFENTFGFDANGRVFYEKDTGTIIKELINENIEQKGNKLVYAGDNLSNVSGGAKIVLGDFRQIKINERGKDILIQYFEKDKQGDFVMNIDNVNFPNDEFLRLNLRMIINNLGGVFNFEVEYRYNGNNYVWELGAIDGVEELKLEPQNATSNNSQVSTSNRLQIRTAIDGGLLEDRAYAVDYITINGVDVTPRNTNLTTDIPTTGNIVTRKFNDDVAEAINKIIQGENASVIVEGNKVIYRRKGQDETDFVVDQSIDDLIDVKLRNEYDSVRNTIEIQGDDDLAVKVNDTNSKSQFNFERIRQFFDESLQREEDAIDVGKEFLRQNALDNQKIQILFGNIERFSQLDLGDDIRVEQPSSNISGDYRIDKISYNTKESIIVVEAVGSSV